MPTEERFLIWSHEHGEWWGPGGVGYTQKVSEAGRYSRDAAFNVCLRAVPQAFRDGVFSEIPVRESDMLDFLAIVRASEFWPTCAI